MLTVREAIATVARDRGRAIHELQHRTVFKSRALNELFEKVYAFISWSDYIWYQASHAKHHLQQGSRQGIGFKGSVTSPQNAVAQTIENGGDARRVARRRRLPQDGMQQREMREPGRFVAMGQQGRLVLNVQGNGPVVRIEVAEQCRARDQGILYQYLPVVAPVMFEQ